jgi:AcrR family transcriptional regulator
VIVLNGGSSSGKTSIGRCMQALLPGSWLLLGVDNLIEALPTEHERGKSPIVFESTGRVTVGPGRAVFEDLGGSPSSIDVVRLDVTESGCPAEAIEKVAEKFGRLDVLINTRARILAAARATIIESGYHAASLEQVAIAAGVTRVTVYRQYGNKRGLLEALADDLAERSDVVALADAADRHSDALMALTELVAALARLWSVDPALMRRLVGLSAVDPEVAVVIASREDWRRQRVRALTARLVNQRVVRLPFNP